MNGGLPVWLPGRLIPAGWGAATRVRQLVGVDAPGQVEPPFPALSTAQPVIAGLVDAPTRLVAGRAVTPLVAGGAVGHAALLRQRLPLPVGSQRIVDALVKRLGVGCCEVIEVAKVVWPVPSVAVVEQPAELLVAPFVCPADVVPHRLLVVGAVPADEISQLFSAVVDVVLVADVQLAMQPAPLDLFFAADGWRLFAPVIIQWSAIAEQPVTELGRRAGLALLCGLAALV